MSPTSFLLDNRPVASQPIIPGSGSIPELTPERLITSSSFNPTSTTVPPPRKACYACRTRKVKCDGQEVCAGCLAHNKECVYDAKPKRRGPDKVPGARRRRSAAPKDLGDLLPPQRIDPEGQTTSYNSAALTSRPNEATNAHPTIPRISSNSDVSVIHPGLDDSSHSSKTGATNSNKAPSQVGFVRSPHVWIPHEESVLLTNGLFTWGNGPIVWDTSPSITHGPSIQFSRKTWWDNLLGIYSSDRHTAIRTITSDLTLLLRNSGNALPFLRVPHLINCILYPRDREKMQPSLVLSVLALSSLMQSLGGHGATPRDRAELLECAARGAFQASISAGWFDLNLAQAAMILALYNVAEQPFETDGLGRPAFHMLDHILSSMSLATLDSPNPAASTTLLPEVGPIVSPGVFPHNHLQRQQTSTLVDPRLPAISASYPSHPPSDSPGDSCDCARLSLASDVPVGSTTLGRDWLVSPRYHPYWTEARITREQIRILVWSAFVMMSGYTMTLVALVGPRMNFMNLRLLNPSNLGLLFPGEALHVSRGFASAGKDSKWALYLRTFLVVQTCLQMEQNNLWRDYQDRRASFVVQMRLEIDRIENALNRHVCKTDLHRSWACRQMLQLMRITITGHDVLWYVPSVHPRSMPPRREATEWAQRAQLTLSHVTVPGRIVSLIAQVPWNPFMSWYLIGLFVRCLQIWEVDNTLIAPLQVAMDMRPALDHLASAFANNPFGLAADCQQLLCRLQEACDTCNIPGPFSPPGP